MDTTIPRAEDHCRILILVKMIGHRSTTTFNHLMKSLTKVEAVDVSENPKRIILARFVTFYNPELVKYGDLQVYRKIFGFIAVANSVQSMTGQLSETRSSIDSTRSVDDVLDVNHSMLIRKTSSFEGNDSLENIREQYNQQKQDLSGSLVDSRCVLIGYNDVSESGIETREMINFTTQEDFESEVRELIRSIYFVLESRRLDLSFEKMDQPPCPCVPDEEKTRVGLDKTTKSYKRKCIGRMRKQVGDYSLLTGLPSLALDSYVSSIEYLKGVTDLLWLAAAYEGYACAAMAIKYNETADRLWKQAAIHRVSTMTPDEIRDHHDKTQHNLGVTLGHQRYRSDDDQRALATAAAAAAQLIEQDLQQRKQYKKPWALLNLDRSPTGKNAFEYTEIIEKFRQALENYERFSFVVNIEYECMIRASSVYRHQRMYLETDSFLRDHVSKYLDDAFTLFDSATKAQICIVYSLIYKEMGFRRKTSFFSRLAVLFKLHVNEIETRTEIDYKMVKIQDLKNKNMSLKMDFLYPNFLKDFELKEFFGVPVETEGNTAIFKIGEKVYPILYRTLPGYGILDNIKDIKKGPVAVQIKALHEVYVSALRANMTDAAIRHLCYILQNYFNDLDLPTSMKMLDELSRLVDDVPRIHSLAQHISLDNSGIILPPLQMTRFPTLSDFKIVRLAPQLAPRIISLKTIQQIFIYSPFQNDIENNDIYWVMNCGCEVSVKVFNPLPVDLTVNNLALLTEGCTFESIPVKLTLPPRTEKIETTEIKLLGMPRAAGKLTITGYSCEVLGVRNVCSIKEILPKIKNENDQKSKKDKFTVEVLQELPLLSLESTLQRSPTTEENVESVAETTIFAGQTFPHSVIIENIDKKITIKSIKISIRQPKVFGTPLIEVTNLEMKKENGENLTGQFKNLKPKEKKEIKFSIFGIDPASISDDKNIGEEQRVLIKRQSMDNLDEEYATDNDGRLSDDMSLLSATTSSKHHDLIPYTGRLLTAELLFQYIADIEGPDGNLYQRTSKLPMAICIIPALTVSSWHVLPGNSPWNRYVVIDVANSTELDAELTYSPERKIISVQSGDGKPPMVPVLVPCCPDVSARSFKNATKYDSQVRQKQEIDILRRSLDIHISKHLQIRWSIPQLNYSGVVPIGSILAEVEFLKQLVVPTVTIDVLINGKSPSKEEDIYIKIGELVEMEIIVSSVLKGTKPIKAELSLKCFQDLANNQTTIDRSENMMLCGPVKVPIMIEPSTGNDLTNGDVSTYPSTTNNKCKSKFTFLFLYEGIHKICPIIEKYPNSTETMLSEDEVFAPTISFNVVTKI